MFVPRPLAGPPREPRSLRKSPFGRALRSLAGLCALGLLTAGIWNLVQEEPVAPTPAASPAPAIRVEGLRSLLVKEKGQPRWKLVARSIDVAADGSSTVVRQVEQGTWYRQGKPYLFLKAPSLVLNNATNDVRAEGGLELKGPSGLLVKTARARWQQITQRLVCPAEVRATVQGWEIDAGSLTYSVPSSRLECAGSVQLRMSGGGLKAPRMVANIQKRTVELSGGVELTFLPGVAMDAASVASRKLKSPVGP